MARIKTVFFSCRPPFSILSLFIFTPAPVSLPKKADAVYVALSCKTIFSGVDKDSSYAKGAFTRVVSWFLPEIFIGFALLKLSIGRWTSQNGDKWNEKKRKRRMMAPYCSTPS
jgi:hypothetical protein